MSAIRLLVAAWAVGASACGTRPLLPTLSLHAVWILRQRSSDVGNDFGLQAQLSFRPRSQAHPRIPRGSAALPLSAAPDCQQSLLCEWQELSEESVLSALGVPP